MSSDGFDSNLNPQTSTLRPKAASADIVKVGVLILQGEAVLLCRKRGLAQLILPGGRIESGETPIACLEREIREELGEVTLVNPVYVGTYEDVAASDPDKIVSIQLYKGDIQGHAMPCSEIEELVVFREGSDWKDLSPILIRKIFPDLMDRGIVRWRKQ